MATVTVFGSSASEPASEDYAAGRRLGEMLAAAGFTVATGGYGGLMEAVSAGAAAGGGRVIGITAPAVFPGRPGANAYVTDERAAATLTERIHQLAEVADATVALPGSIGTLAELAVVWHLAYVAGFSGAPAKPVVAVGPVWKNVITDLAAAVAADASLVTCVETVDEAAAAVQAALASL